MKARVILVIGGMLLVAFTFTYPNWKAIFTGETGRLVFPGLTEAENNVFQLLSSEQRAAFHRLLDKDPTMAVAMVRAALQPNTTVPLEQQSMPVMLVPSELAYGEFVALDAVRWASGNFILYREADDTKLLRLENFRSAPGPDLRVYLAVAPPTDEDGMIMGEAWANWELREPFLDLGALRGTIGNQNFVIAPEVDPRRYSMVIIYSAVHDLLISAAPFRVN